MPDLNGFGVETWHLIVAAALFSFLVLLVVSAGWWLLRQSRRRRQTRAVTRPELAVDVVALGVSGPPAEGPQLEVYGVPVRLAVIVVAPRGRLSELPDESRLDVLLERITPRLSQVRKDHAPVVKDWPAQLSFEGFSHAFSHHVRLPTASGGSAWCAVVGPISSARDKVLVGLVGRSAGPHQIGTVVIQQEGLWRDVLRVRGS